MEKTKKIFERMRGGINISGDIQTMVLELKLILAVIEKKRILNMEAGKKSEEIAKRSLKPVHPRADSVSLIGSVKSADSILIQVKHDKERKRKAKLQLQTAAKRNKEKKTKNGQTAVPTPKSQKKRDTIKKIKGKKLQRPSDDLIKVAKGKSFLKMLVSKKSA